MEPIKKIYELHAQLPFSLLEIGLFVVVVMESREGNVDLSVIRKKAGLSDPTLRKAVMNLEARGVLQRYENTVTIFGAPLLDVKNDLYSRASSGLTFPLKGQAPWLLPNELHKRLREAYSDCCDVDKELHRAKLWLIANPARCKTTQGMPRFLQTWLSKASRDVAHREEKGGSNVRFQTAVKARAPFVA
jgi:hypothetical protein